MKVTATGIETFYQKMGQGTPLVLLHGWGCDWQIWHTLISPLSETYQLIIPDMPGFGQSSNPESAWSSMTYVEWLASFLDQVEKSKVLLVGHSFGGKVAALFAVKYPDKVSKLVLIDSAGIPDRLSVAQSAKQGLISLIPGPLKNSLSSTTRQKILSRLGVSSDHTFSTPTQRIILREVVKENIQEQLTLITQPTLLIWGENDPDTPPHQAKLFQQAIKGSQLVLLPNAGHFSFIDQPQAVLKHLKDFLS